jgi:pyridoxal phosphate enzyme (YggS family)
MPQPSSVAAKLASIRARIDAAARAAGRDPAAVTLVAVSKTHGQEAVRAAMEAGQMVFGENRVPEAAEKFPALLTQYPEARLHLIGPLQSNKALEAFRLAHVIETLDRPKLSDALAKYADTYGMCPKLLVQINIGDEPQKAGVATAEADVFIRESSLRFGNALVGVMCIPPVGMDPVPFFRKTVAIADVHGLAVRSMGMSGDFEAAIAEGATHVRIGSAIFGARPAPVT